MQRNSYPLSRKLAAWGVHTFTASGMVAGFMGLLAISEGHFREAMLWLAVCQFIDGFDGTLARWVNVEAVLPNMSGKMIDAVVDFANYALIPAYFIYSAGLMASPLNELAAALILLVSALYYGKDGMISEDFYFVGFPVLWNLVAFYLFFVLDLSSTANFAVIAILCILHFVPLKVAYPSRAKSMRWLTFSLAFLWLLLSAAILWIYPETNRLLNGGMLFLLAGFGALTIKDSLK